MAPWPGYAARPMQDLPAFGLANTITGFATLFAGLTGVILCATVRPHGLDDDSWAEEDRAHVFAYLLV